MRGGPRRLRWARWRVELRTRPVQPQWERVLGSSQSTNSPRSRALGVTQLQFAANLVAWQETLAALRELVLEVEEIVLPAFEQIEAESDDEMTLEDALERISELEAALAEVRQERQAALQHSRPRALGTGKAGLPGRDQLED